MRKAFFQLHMAVFLAGFTGVLGRLISLQEGLIVWYRLLFSAATMWVLFSLTKTLKPLRVKDIGKVSGIGCIAALHWVGFYAAIKYANVSVALVCFSAVGFFTAVFEPIIFRKKVVWVELLLGVMVMAGIFIIFHFDPQYKKGILFGIVSSMLGAIFPILNRQMMQRMNAPTLMTWELTGGWVSLSLLLPFYFQAVPPVYWLPTFSDLLWLLVLSWFCSVWAFQLSANALKSISAFTVNLTYNLEPLYGIILAFLIYKENQYLGISFYVGISIILLAVLLQTGRVYRQRKRY